jgi:addiction module HigA family antidote
MADLLQVVGRGRKRRRNYRRSLGATDGDHEDGAHPSGRDLASGLPPADGISQYRLAKDISVPPRRINEIVHGERSITADTALRLSRYFGVSERFWVNLQARYDLETEKERLGKRLDREVVKRPA